MSPEPRFIHEQPNSENTIPVELYRASSPEKFSLEDDDKFVVYGGGSNYRMNFLTSGDQELILDEGIRRLTLDDISLFVLNTYVIIWFNQDNIGLELPYQTISLHAVKPPSHQDGYYKLYLQILSNKLISTRSKSESEFISTTEIEISENNQHQNHHPLLKTQSNIEHLYIAMSKCSQFHFDSDSENDDENQVDNFQLDQTPSLEIPSGWLTNHDNDDNHIDEAEDDHDFILPNTGIADDLEFDDDHDDSGDNNVAGMYVDIGYGPIAGSVRKRENDVQVGVKSRRIQ